IRAGYELHDAIAIGIDREDVCRDRLEVDRSAEITCLVIVYAERTVCMSLSEFDTSIPIDVSDTRQPVQYVSKRCNMPPLRTELFIEHPKATKTSTDNQIITKDD